MRLRQKEEKKGKGRLLKKMDASYSFILAKYRARINIWNSKLKTYTREAYIRSNEQVSQSTLQISLEAYEDISTRERVALVSMMKRNISQNFPMNSLMSAETTRL